MDRYETTTYSPHTNTKDLCYKNDTYIIVFPSLRGDFAGPAFLLLYYSHTFPGAQAQQCNYAMLLTGNIATTLR